MISPKHLLLAGVILFAIGLIAGLFAARKLARPLRLLWLLPLLGLVSFTLYLAIGKNEETRQAVSLFGRLDSAAALTPDEADVFRSLATAPPRVREKVIRLAFASDNNAARALPRLGFLLHACVDLEPVPGLPEKLWSEIAAPAVRKRPSPEIIRLAAATADFLSLGTNAVHLVASPLLVLMQNETNRGARLMLLQELIPLAARMQPAQSRILADSLLRALAAEPEPLASNHPLVVGLVGTIASFDPEWKQRTLAEAFSLADAQSHPSRAAALASSLADLRDSMIALQRAQLAEVLASTWLESGGTVRPDVIARLTGLIKLLAPHQAEQVVRSALAKTQPHSSSIFYRTWGEAIAPMLEEAANRMGPEYTANIVTGYFSLVREPWSDLLWARWIGGLLRGRPAVESEPLARQLLHLALQAHGQSRTWFVERFAAVANQLEPEPARQLCDLILEQLPRTVDSYEFDALASCLVKLSTRLDRPGANQIAQCLLATLHPERVTEYLSLSRAFEPLAPRLDAFSRRAIVDSLLAAMNRGRNPYRLGLLAQRFAPFANSVGPNVATVVTARLLEAMEAENDLDGIVVLAPGLAALAPFMTEPQSRRAGEVLVRGLAADPRQLFLAGPAIEELSRHIGPDQSRRAVDLLLARGSRLGPDLFWAQKAPSLAAALTPDLAQSLLDQLTAQLSAQRDPTRIDQQVQTAAPFAGQLGPNQIPWFSERLLQTLESNTNSYALAPLLLALNARVPARTSSPRAFIAGEESVLEIHALRGLCRALANLFPRMAEPDASRLASRLAWRFRQQGWFRPLPYDPELANALQYAPTESLTSILRTPFAVGGLRQTTLRALELKGTRASQSAAL